MKALVYEGPHVLNIRDVPNPVPQEGEHLIRIDSVGICGSDMHGYHGQDSRRPAPLILGHEAAGVIEGGPRDGERVTVNPLVPDPNSAATKAGRENICPNRQLISMPPREGAFAQYLAMPEENLVTVPDDVPLSKAALAEPLSVSWHAARLSVAALHPAMDKRALVIGGGAIGLAAALCLRAQGIEDITIAEPNTLRRAFLIERTEETVVERGEGLFPLVVDAVGYAATRAIASERVEAGGVITHIGLGDSEGGLDIRRMTLQEITFIGTYCYTKAEFKDCAQAIFDGSLGDLNWTEERALSGGAAAFHDLDSGKVAAPKIVLRPW